VEKKIVIDLINRSEISTVVSNITKSKRVLIMSQYVMIACPRCGNQSQIDVEFKVKNRSSGSMAVNCNKCNRTYSMYFQDGQITEVKS